MKIYVICVFFLNFAPKFNARHDITRGFHPGDAATHGRSPL